MARHGDIGEKYKEEVWTYLHTVLEGLRLIKCRLSNAAIHDKNHERWFD